MTNSCAEARLTTFASPLLVRVVFINRRASNPSVDLDAALYIMAAHGWRLNILPVQQTEIGARGFLALPQPSCFRPASDWAMAQAEDTRINVKAGAMLRESQTNP